MITHPFSDINPSLKNTFGFIIPSYCETDLHVSQLNRCIQSIRRFHSYEKIIIIDDYSSIDFSFIEREFSDVQIVKSRSKGAGDMVTYSVFRDHPVFETAVIMQDSMCLEKKMDRIQSIDSINFIWYFTNHRLHWSIIEEPQDHYNIKHNIKVHDDLVVHCIDRFIEKDEFKYFAKELYFKKSKWSGCFGCSSIIKYSFLIELDEKTGIIDLLSKMNTNRLRRAAESIFAIACMYVLGEQVFEKAYDGLYYDGIHEPKNRMDLKAIDAGFGKSDIMVNQCCKNDYFSKISFNRNS